ncbi:MAG: LamG-like jellyroll fold domain-containing protein [Planctomycetota bacterium]
MRFDRKKSLLSALCVGAVGIAGVNDTQAALVVNYSFEETTPSTFVDSVGGESNGATSGGVQFDVPGVSGSGIRHDGVDDNIQAGPNSSEFKRTGDFTLTMWVNLENQSADTLDRIITTSNFNGSFNDNGSGWRLIVNDVGGDTNRVALQAASSSSGRKTFASAFTDVRGLQADGWNLVVLRWDEGANAELTVLYDTDLNSNTLDATFVDSNSATRDISGLDPLNYGGGAIPRIGSNQSASANLLPAAFDEIAFYDTVLTDAEIASIYTTIIPEPSSLVLLAIGAGLVTARRRKDAAQPSA